VRGKIMPRYRDLGAKKPAPSSRKNVKDVRPSCVVMALLIESELLKIILDLEAKCQP
jgi:hypothetical protein